MIRAYAIRVKGIVQGVGFRPFIYQLASRFGVAGTVINDTAGVLIEAEAEENILDEFIRHISSEAPPLAHVYSVEKTVHAPAGLAGFAIGKSAMADERTVFYSPDIALCPDCLREFMDPADRRYRYPFITCINCGPRFSIVNDIPYDRANTSMDRFPLCPDCAAEYADSSNRRFHTQPTACHACGPRMTLRDSAGNILAEDIGSVASMTVDMLKKGKIGAIKGFGGYHLAVDALNGPAVAELRARKKRPFKPFALMAGGMGMIESFLAVSDEERKLLLSKECPVVLLKEIRDHVARNISPGLTWQGIMLPYAPFQHLLFSLDPEMVLVMTSGNLSEEPIAYRDGDAFERLGVFADFFVTYDREIIAQNDDSVLFVELGRPLFVRRSRGYVPAPFASRMTDRKILAVGGDLKNSFAIARNDFVIVSQYLGDMADAMTHAAFRSSVSHFTRIFDAAPDVIVSDMHPGYLTTAFADELAAPDLKRIQVQHHHAHIASVLEERGIDGPVIGIAFDGTGYGPDGTLWGSEFLVASRKSFSRAAHFGDFPLPGGESAIKDVWKIGLSLLYRAYGRDYPVMPHDAASTVLLDALDRGINAPLTCSIGRIFDGVAAVLGIARSVSSEAEAAMLLEESAARGGPGCEGIILPWTNDGCRVVSTDELVRHVVSMMQEGRAVDDIAASFHRTISITTAALARELRIESGLNTAVLSGGVFHNRILLRGIYELLSADGFEVLVPEKVPVNDGCISLGQVSVAKAILA